MQSYNNVKAASIGGNTSATFTPFQNENSQEVSLVDPAEQQNQGHTLKRNNIINSLSITNRRGESTDRGRGKIAESAKVDHRLYNNTAKNTTTQTPRFDE